MKKKINKSTKVPQKKKIKPNEMTDTSLRGLYVRYMNNFHYGTTEIAELSKEDIKMILFSLLQECLYSQTTSPFLYQMYDKNVFPYEERMWDTQLIPLVRKQLLNGMEDMIVGGGRKKFSNLLNKLTETLHTGELK
jgi:hypothetical protein